MKFALMGLCAVLTLGLTSCGDKALVEQVLDQALNTPSLAIKNNGQALESIRDAPEEIDGPLFFLPSISIYNAELDLEFDVTITWTYDEATASNWAPLRERTEIPGLITNTLIYLAIPYLPAYETEPVASAVTATASVEYNGKSYSKSKTFAVKLMPETVDVSNVPLIPLNTATAPTDGPKDSYGGAVVRMQGYLTRNMLDWDSAYIQAGSAGINLYKLSLSPVLLTIVSLGDFIEVMGTFAVYNGMRQLSYISRISIVPPGEDAAIVPTVVTEATWSTLRVGNDGSVVRIEGLTFDAAGTGNVTIGGHVTIKMKLGAVGVNVYLNYHNDLNGTTVRRQAIYDILSAAVNGATVTYEGTLGWYNGPQLLPIPVSDVTLVPAAS